VRRLARHSFTTAAALSLMLCIASATLWVRSHWRSDVASYGAENRWRAIGTVVDGVVVERLKFNPQPGFILGSDLAEPWDFPFQVVGFGFGRSPFIAAIRIPFWFVTVASAALPILWVWKRRRRTSPRRGFEVGPGGEGNDAF
jgi:hypothetical protein